jgi:hypothetical protein
MPASQIHVVVGDTAPPLRATLSNADGPQDLTGATVVLRLKPNTGGPVLEVDMDIDADPTTGVVTHTWDPSETAAALRYTAEFVVTFADETVQTFPNESSQAPTISIRARRTA